MVLSPPIRGTALLVCLLFGFAADDVDSLIATIKGVGREGANNEAAARAWQQLVRRGPEALPTVLAGFDGADATAANWLRMAVDAVAERTTSAKQSLPVADLEAFIQQTNHAPQARRLAYEWLARVDATTPSRLLPGMLNDPSTALRRDAVALVIKNADELLAAGQKDKAKAAYRKALTGARDRDQVNNLAKQLKELGIEIDLAAHFGLVRHWHLIGPFDNAADVGFAAVYPPEKGVDLAAMLRGKKEAELRWSEHSTNEAYGIVDLNKAIGKHMGATGYAYAVVESKTERPVEIRAGSNNSIKIFLNGKMLYFKDEYHHGMTMDQHVGKGTLRAGRNELLVKICQNEQTDAWAQSWSFQVRLCDSVGGAVPFTIAQSSR
jgi:hypothetical protein